MKSDPEKPVANDRYLALPVDRLRSRTPVGRQAGCPFYDIYQKLDRAGVRPTRQRLALAWLIFANGDRHVTADMLHEEAARAHFSVSLTTVYSTLFQFAELNLLREFAVDGTKTYFDTNTSDHHHFYVEDGKDLIDIPAPAMNLLGLPPPPMGYEVRRINILVRLRRRA